MRPGQAALRFSVGAIALLMITLASLAARYYTLPTPPLAVSLSSPVTRMSDYIGIALGLRKLTADLAWIETLIYYGTPEGEEEHEEGGAHHHHFGDEDSGDKYPQFLAYCQRVAHIDPHFKYVYYYGGAVLGWNLNRVDEAERLLKEGIKAHPDEWRYKQFLAGIAFQKNHDINALVTFLNGFSSDPNCPNVLRSILANIYKKQKDYRSALRVWIQIYDSGDAGYRTRALEQIEMLTPLAGIRPTNRP